MASTEDYEKLLFLYKTEWKKTCPSRHSAFTMVVISDHLINGTQILSYGVIQRINGNMKVG